MRTPNHQTRFLLAAALASAGLGTSVLTAQSSDRRDSGGSYESQGRGQRGQGRQDEGRWNDYGNDGYGNRGYDNRSYGNDDYDNRGYGNDDYDNRGYGYGDEGYGDSRGNRDRDSRGRQQGDMQRQDSRDRSRSSDQRSSSNWRLRPDAWVSVGYDVDSDGDIDYYETLWGYDLIRAQEQSRTRNGDRGQQSMRDRGSRQDSQRSRSSRNDSRSSRNDLRSSRNDSRSSRNDSWSSRYDQGRSGRQQDGRMRNDARAQNASFSGGSSSVESRARNQGRSSSKPAVYRVKGEIRSMKDVDLVAQDDPFVVATLDTEQGRSAKVALGPRPDLPDPVHSGESLEVIGTIGKLDGRPLLIADRVRHDGETFGIERPDDAGLQRCEGTLQSKRTVRYKDMDEEHVQARIRIREGRTALVDLGPRSRIDKLDLAQGDRVRFLADPVRIGGEPALRAEQLRVDGRTIDLDRSRERQRMQPARSSRRSSSGGNRSSGR